MDTQSEPSVGAVIEQELIPVDTTWDDLPNELERQCCPGELRNTTVYKTLVPILDKNSPTGASVLYGYRRDNDETYFGSSSIVGLIEQINDRGEWPVVGG